MLVQWAAFEKIWDKKHPFSFKRYRVSKHKPISNFIIEIPIEN